MPLEPALREGSDSGDPVFVSDPDDPSSRAIAAIAQRIAASGPAPARAGAHRLAARRPQGLKLPRLPRTGDLRAPFLRR